MFESETIPPLINLFETRNVYLYHSCQYQDFCAYIKLGGIPSRKSLENAQLSMTSFTTDENDKQNGVWDKVFLNLEDFGTIFASGKAGVPNVYGPILFRFKPLALSRATDIAVCLRSAGASNFNRQTESLSKISDVDKLFYFPSNRPNLKFKPYLQEVFGTQAQSVEISCTFPDGILPFKELVDIVVDPYIINGQKLSNIVASFIESSDFDFSVKNRTVKIDPNLYQVFLSENATENTSPKLLVTKSNSSQLIKWADKIEETGGLLLKNYYRFLKYLRNGTFLVLNSQTQAYRLNEPEKKSTLTVESFSDDEYTEFEDNISFDEEENEIIIEELCDYINSWARSSEDGWYYADYDNHDDYDGFRIVNAGENADNYDYDDEDDDDDENDDDENDVQKQTNNLMADITQSQKSADENDGESKDDKENDTKKETNNMAAGVIQSQKSMYKNHLEFLGYKIEDDPDNEKNITMIQGGVRTFATVFNNGFRCFLAYEFTENAENDRLSFLEFINDCNDKHIAKVSANKKTFFVEMWYFCPYEKISFGEFIKLFNNESDKILDEAGKKNFV
jgi:hypothetical protein